MKKVTNMLLASLLLVTGVSNAFAADSNENFLRPINVQNAYIDTDKKWEIRAGFDWARRNNASVGALNSFALPRVDVRRSFDTAIPTRVGVSGALDMSVDDHVAARLGNIGLTLEAALINKPEFASTLYVNQHIPLLYNNGLTSTLWRPTHGSESAYSFQTGLENQFRLFSDNLTVYSDLGYRYDHFGENATGHSFVYSTEAVLDTNTPVNLSLGMLGITTYSDKDVSKDTGIAGTDLRLVPGIIVPFGKEDDTQLRIGVPIGLTSESPDFGVQASIFAAL